MTREEFGSLQAGDRILVNMPDLGRRQQTVLEKHDAYLTFTGYEWYHHDEIALIAKLPPKEKVVVKTNNLLDDTNGADCPLTRSLCGYECSFYDDTIETCLIRRFLASAIAYFGND